MNKLSLIFMVLILMPFNYGQTNPIQNNFFSNSSGAKIILTGKFIKFNKNELKIDFVLANRSDKSIYVAIDPIQLYGELGYYLLLDKTDNSILQVSSQVYSPPPFYPYVDKRGVKLKELKSGEEYRESIFIKLPTMETRPPNYGRGKKDIFPGDIEQIKLTIGYFVEDEGIIEFLKRKPFGWYIKGEEIFSIGKYKDKSFLEIQNLATTEISNFKNKDK